MGRKIHHPGGPLIAKLNQRFKVVFRLKNVIADIFCGMFCLNFANKWSVLIADRMNRLTVGVDVGPRSYRMLSNSDLLMYRTKTFHDKEPETNRWIKSIPKEGVLFDVGANVGVFTILAATFCQKVYAFEPIALNYSVLNQNLMLNALDDKAIAFCLAISDRAVFDTMRLSSGVVGSAHHSFGVNRDACHKEYSPVFRQGALGISLDELVYKYQFDCPTFLKIDVDGNEHLVIRGASELLKDLRLKSVLIELNKNLNLDQELIKTIESNGFQLTEVGEEATFNGMKIGNLIFFRNDFLVK